MSYNDRYSYASHSLAKNNSCRCWRHNCPECDGHMALIESVEDEREQRQQRYEQQAVIEPPQWVRDMWAAEAEGTD